MDYKPFVALVLAEVGLGLLGKLGSADVKEVSIALIGALKDCFVAYIGKN